MVFTEFGKLKEIIVGRELKFSERQLDFTIKNMYNDNLKMCNMYSNNFEYYSLSKELIQNRNKQLDNLTTLLEYHNVKVYRPEELNNIVIAKTPDYSMIQSSASNVRDITFIYGDVIIETPILVQNRLFENTLLYNIFKTKSKEDYNWIKSPYTKLTNETLDLDNWEIDRDFNNIPDKYEMGFDAANIIKIGSDLICNVSTYNQYLGFIWLKKILTRFFPNINIHMIKVADSHIDGTILPLKPGVFLANNVFIGKQLEEQLPQKFKNWKILYTNDYYQKDDQYWKDIYTNPVKLASTRGMDTNVLSLDENKIMILNEAIKTQDLLYKNGFEPIPVVLDHGEIFAGGIHCSTLDISRDDEFLDYTK